MRKMIIGLAPIYVENKDEIYGNYYKFIQLYSKKLIDADMIPMGLLLDGENINEKQLEACDGFLIQGGNKVNKYIYEIIHYAIKYNKPLLGICLGAQALAIYSLIEEKMNGTENIEEIRKIYEELKKENNGSLLYKLPDGNIHNNDYLSHDYYENSLHTIDILPNTIAYSIFKKLSVDVTSMHNIGFKMVGKNFRVTAKANDGVYEMIEYNKPGYFIVGTQFHPEVMNCNIFEKLKEECIKRIGIN